MQQPSSSKKSKKKKRKKQEVAEEEKDKHQVEETPLWRKLKGESKVNSYFREKLRGLTKKSLALKTASKDGIQVILCDHYAFIRDISTYHALPTTRNTTYYNNVAVEITL